MDVGDAFPPEHLEPLGIAGRRVALVFYGRGSSSSADLLTAFDDEAASFAKFDCSIVGVRNPVAQEYAGPCQGRTWPTPTLRTSPSVHC